MKLTAKMILTLILVAVPITTAFTMWRLNVERNRAAEARVEKHFARAASKIARRCARGGPRRPVRRRRGMAMVIYDATFEPLAHGAPAMPAGIEERLRAGDEVVHIHERNGEMVGASAFQMEDAGECAYVLFVWERHPAPDVAPFVVLTQVLALVFGLVLTGGLVGFPLVRRIRRLTAAVEASPDDPESLRRSGATEPQDELGDLARAHAAALDQIGEHVRELEERDAALEAYIGNTTHDLAVPLTVVQHRLRRLHGRVDEDSRELVDEILEESAYIAALVANMAAAARLEAGDEHLTFHRVDLSEVVSRVAGRIEPIAKGRDVEFNWAVPPEPVTVKGDSTLIEQAVSNLAQNAVQYSGEAGRVVLLLESSGADWSIEVFDDGPGIPEVMLEAVMERSVRGDAVRTRNEGGSGFGLAIVREVVARHGWTLRLKNRDEGGLSATIAPAASSEG